LEAITQTKVASLSYPFNAQNNRVKAIAARYYEFARWNRSYPPLRVNSVSPRDKMQVNAVATILSYDPIVLPLRLVIYLAKRIGHRPRPKGFEARIVRKWLRSLRKDQWLVLTFHSIQSDKSPSLYSIDLKAFREIVKVVDELAEVVNFGTAART
jgi:hypothetical protein